MLHIGLHFIFAMLCIGWGAMLGIGVGADARRWLRSRYQGKRALQSSGQELGSNCHE